MTLLWGSLLQTHLAQQQKKQEKQQQQRSGKGSVGSESSGSAAWNSDGSASSAASSSSSRGGQQQQSGMNGVNAADVQSVWKKQYTPVLVDISYMLTAQSNRLAAAVARPPAAAAAAVPASPTAAGCSPRAAAAATQQPPVSMDSPEFKMMVTHLVQFLAANGLWAVLQMVTDSVYGVGASAKALYSAKAASSAAASAAPSMRGYGSSSSSGSGNAVFRTSQAVQVPEGPDVQTAAGNSVTTDRAVSCIPGLLPAAAAVDAGSAVASALAAAEAGDRLEMSAVMLLFLLALRNNIMRGVRFCHAEGLAPALGQLGRVLGGWLRQLGLGVLQAVTLLVVGMAWGFESVMSLVTKERTTNSPPASPPAVATAAMHDANASPEQ